VGFVAIETAYCGGVDFGAREAPGRGMPLSERRQEHNGDRYENFKLISCYYTLNAQSFIFDEKL
jgi:hypothetical protein